MERPKEKGHTHPITHVINEIARPLIEMGFEVALGCTYCDSRFN